MSKTILFLGIGLFIALVFIRVFGMFLDSYLSEYLNMIFSAGV